MGAPGAETCAAGDHPIAPFDGGAVVRGGRAGREDFEAGFIAWNGGCCGCAVGGCEGGGGGIAALDLIDVGWIEGGG